MIFYKIKS